MQLSLLLSVFATTALVLLALCVKFLHAQVMAIWIRLREHSLLPLAVVMALATTAILNVLVRKVGKGLGVNTLHAPINFLKSLTARVVVFVTALCSLPYVLAVLRGGWDPVAPIRALTASKCPWTRTIVSATQVLTALVAM